MSVFGDNVFAVVLVDLFGSGCFLGSVMNVFGMSSEVSWGNSFRGMCEVCGCHGGMPWQMPWAFRDVFGDLSSEHVLERLGVSWDMSLGLGLRWSTCKMFSDMLVFEHALSLRLCGCAFLHSGLWPHEHTHYLALDGRVWGL